MKSETEGSIVTIPLEAAKKSKSPIKNRDRKAKLSSCSVVAIGSRKEVSQSDLIDERIAFQKALRAYEDFFGSTLLKDINTARVEEFRSYLLNKRVGKRFLKNASANRYISMLRAALYWGMSRGDIASNPVSDPSPPRTTRKSYGPRVPNGTMVGT